MESRWVCGIDMGSLNTPSYVAWLKEKEFLLDMYRPTVGKPLPMLPFPDYVASYAIDAPQGLPSKGEYNRLCDKQAVTPTNRLPEDRHALATWKLYGGLVRCGVEIFWSIHSGKHARVFGFEGSGDMPIVAETYPRRIALRWELPPRLPSKSNDAVTYVNFVWSHLKSLGYHCHSVIHPTVDQVDAMLCATAAETLAMEPDKAVIFGTKPQVDNEESVLREGYIVCSR